MATNYNGIDEEERKRIEQQRLAEEERQRKEREAQQAAQAAQNAQNAQTQQAQTQAQQLEESAKFAGVRSR
ncbi:MAG: hypothetical protein Q4C03_08000, partial [bacterium]|nr:hypothetical protein [bacterium]